MSRHAAIFERLRHRRTHIAWSRWAAGLFATPSGGRRNGALRRICAGALAVIIAMPIGVGMAVPAFAAPGEYLQISKSVDKYTLAPGDSFTYTVQVTCSEVDCENAFLVDPLP